MRLESLDPRLLVVHLGGTREGAPDPEAEARIATTRGRGTCVLVRLGTDLLDDPSKVPATLHPSTAWPASGELDLEGAGEWEAPWAELLPAAAGRARLPHRSAWLAGIGREDDRSRLLLGPPSRGAITVWVAQDDEEASDAASKLLLSPRAHELIESLEARARRVARALDRRSSFDLVPESLLSAEVLESAFEASAIAHGWHTERGGEFVTECALGEDGTPFADLGRHVVRSESFALPAAPPATAQADLVLLRRTHPRDAGKVLRVLVDDEDLGPWHLGAHGLPGRWSDDVLRVPYEIWAERAGGHLRLVLPEAQDLASFRVRWRSEPRFDGTWLGDLDQEPSSGSGSNGPRPCVDRDERGGALGVERRAFLRGLCVAAPSEHVHLLPSGYEWFEAWVGTAPFAGDELRLVHEIEVDGEVRFRSDPLASFDPGMAARVRLDGARRLVLRCLPLTTTDRWPSPLPGRWAAARLWREPRRTTRSWSPR